MKPEIVKMLNEEVVGEQHDKILKHVRELVETSRNHMSGYYKEWDKRVKVYNAERVLDKEDAKAVRDGEPPKMVVPLSFAQVNTFVAFLILLFFQRSRFFELKATGSEDNQLREVSELGLETDTKLNKWVSLCFQLFLDIARFGLGIVKHGWTEETATVTVLEERKAFGQTVAKTPVKQNVVVREYTKAVVVSPYRFFPDCRLPLTRFQEGEFCASEDEYTKIALQTLEKNGAVAGVKHIQPFTGEFLTGRRENSRFANINLDEPHKDTNMTCITEVQVKLVPSDFDLGDETFPVMYVVWYANDSRIVRLEEMNYVHDSFTYALQQFTPDQHCQLNKSLSAIIDVLQTTVDWYMNARVASVRRTLDNQLVVDPSGVDMTTVENRSRVILLKKGASRTGVDRYIMPLPVTDVTAGHLSDVQLLMGPITEGSTGINQQMLGQAHTGRRSATEMRNVAQGAASRITMVGSLIWEGIFEPIGRCMLLNRRQNISQEGYTSFAGQGQEAQGVYAAYKADPVTLAKSSDFFVFDGTAPSEKQYMAQVLQELLGIVLQNPQSAQMLGIVDAQGLLREIYALRGMGGLERFSQMSPEMAQTQQIMAQMAQLQQGGVPQQQPQPTNAGV